MINGNIAIWKNALLGKYLYNSNFFNTLPKASDSWIWKCIFHQKDFLKKSVYFHINNSTSTKVWNDPWIPTQPNFQPNPKNMSIEKDLSMTVAELIVKEPRIWNIILLPALFHPDTMKKILKSLLAQTNFHKSE